MWGEQEDRRAKSCLEKKARWNKANNSDNALTKTKTATFELN